MITIHDVVITGCLTRSLISHEFLSSLRITPLSKWFKYVLGKSCRTPYWVPTRSSLELICKILEQGTPNSACIFKQGPNICCIDTNPREQNCFSTPSQLMNPLYFVAYSRYSWSSMVPTFPMPDDKIGSEFKVHKYLQFYYCVYYSLSPLPWWLNETNKC